MIFERIPGWIRSATALAVLLTVVADAEAQQAGITKIVIDTRESPAYGGRTFGEAGRSPKILRGRAIGKEGPPENPGNTGIVYIDKALRNARGNVEYDVDLVIIKPIDMARGNQTLFYSVNNRGRVPFNNADGDGFLMRHGFTLVWSGWHADVPKDAIRARFPVAKNVDGSFRSESGSRRSSESVIWGSASPRFTPPRPSGPT